MVRVASVEVLHGYRLRLAFTDGKQRIVDLSSELSGPIFEPLRNPTVFRQSASTKSSGQSYGPTVPTSPSRPSIATSSSRPTIVDRQRLAEGSSGPPDSCGG